MVLTILVGLLNWKRLKVGLSENVEFETVNVLTTEYYTFQCKVILNSVKKSRN